MNSFWLYAVGYLLFCLVIPITWGWAVDRVFHWFELRRAKSKLQAMEEEHTNSASSNYWDYQI